MFQTTNQISISGIQFGGKKLCWGSHIPLHAANAPCFYSEVWPKTDAATVDTNMKRILFGILKPRDNHDRILPGSFPTKQLQYINWSNKKRMICVRQLGFRNIR